MPIIKTDNMTLKTSIINLSGRFMAAAMPLGALALSLCLTSCEPIFDNRSDCKTGVALAFNFDYHMERGANAFPANVDCVDVLVFDKDGNYIDKFTETSSALQDRDYRMEIPLPEGDYHFVIYGGLACENPTFDITPTLQPAARSASVTKNDIVVTLPTDEDGVSKKQLHDLDKRTGGLFYGTHDITITPDDLSQNYREETANVMKNTNTITVMLQELSQPDKVDYNDYGFYIIDTNFRLDAYNNPIISTLDEGKLYKPYFADNRTTGYISNTQPEGPEIPDDARPVQVAVVEFSTNRLFIDNYCTARLVVTNKKELDDDGNEKTIINIPLIEYLLLSRGHGDGWIKSDQEYLDRQSRWSLLFFLQRNVWVTTSISVNSWIVRLNNITL